MESLMVVVAGVFGCVVLLVFWMAMRLVKLGRTAELVPQMQTHIDDLRERLRELERGIAATLPQVPARQSVPMAAEPVPVPSRGAAQQRQASASTSSYPVTTLRAAPDDAEAPPISADEPPPARQGVCRAAAGVAARAERKAGSVAGRAAGKKLAQ